jgi:hypothetical protein
MHVSGAIGATWNDQRQLMKPFRAVGFKTWGGLLSPLKAPK